MGRSSLLRQAALALIGLVALTRVVAASLPARPNTVESLEQKKRELALWNKKLEQRERALREREKELGLAKKPLASSSSSSSSSGTQELVFEETFDHLDLDLWRHEITLGGGGNWEFQYYTNNRTNSYVENNVLYLQPTLSSDALGQERVTGQEPYRLDLWGSSPGDACTSNQFYGCERASDATQHRVLNPVQSARLRTAGTFSFKYGRLEVEAKLPKGDWLWPAIWLLPENNAYGNWPASGEIDLLESRGNEPGYVKGGYDTMSSCLHWAPYFELDAYAKTFGDFKLDKGSFNDDFHTFGLVWDENGLYTYVDTEDQKVLQVDFKKDSFWTRGGFEKLGLSNPWSGRSNAAPFDQPYYLIFNVAVGGMSNFFPDGYGKKPWTNHDTNAPYKFLMAQKDWYSTWEEKESALQIRSVRVWQTPKSLSSTTATDLRGHHAIIQDDMLAAASPSTTSSSSLAAALMGTVACMAVILIVGLAIHRTRGGGYQSIRV